MVYIMTYTRAGAAALFTAVAPAFVAALPAPLPTSRDVGAALDAEAAPAANAVVIPAAAAPDPREVCLGIRNSTLKVCWDLIETDQGEGEEEAVLIPGNMSIITAADVERRAAAATTTRPPRYSTTPVEQPAGLPKRALNPLSLWSWLGWQHQPTTLDAVAEGPTATLHIDMAPASAVPTTQQANPSTRATATTTTSISTTCLHVTDSTKTVCVGSDELIFPPGMELPPHHIPIPILSRHPTTNTHVFSHPARPITTMTTTTPPPSPPPQEPQDDVVSFPSSGGWGWNPLSWWSWAYNFPPHPRTSSADVTTFASATGTSTPTPTTTTTDSLFIGPRGVAASASTPTPTIDSLLDNPNFVGPRDVDADADAAVVIPNRPPLPITKAVDKPPLPITKAVEKPPLPITKAVDRPPLPITKAADYTPRAGDVKADLPGVPVFTAWGEGAGRGMAMPRPSIGVFAVDEDIDDDDDEGPEAADEIVEEDAFDDGPAADEPAEEETGAAGFAKTRVVDRATLVTRDAVDDELPLRLPTPIESNYDFGVDTPNGRTDPDPEAPAPALAPLVDDIVLRDTTTEKEEEEGDEAV